MKEFVGCNTLCIMQLQSMLDIHHRVVFQLFALSEPSISFKVGFLLSWRVKSLFGGVSVFSWLLRSVISQKLQEKYEVAGRLVWTALHVLDVEGRRFVFGYVGLWLAHEWSLLAV